MTQCLSMPKITQNVLCVLKMWAVKHSGPVFWPTLYKSLLSRAKKHAVFIFKRQPTGGDLQESVAA